MIVHQVVSIQTWFVENKKIRSDVITISKYLDTFF